jgi:hypothetical protein
MNTIPNEEDYTNVVRIDSTTSLPHIFIPYHSVTAARAKHPDGKLYVFEPGVPAGFRIVAFPVFMTKEDAEKAEAAEGKSNVESA